MSERMRLALEAGALRLPEGRLAVFRPPLDARLEALGEIQVVTGFYPDHANWSARGFDVSVEPTGAFSGAVVFLPRSKVQGRDLIAQGAGYGPVIVDGQKADGVESILKALKGLGAVTAPFSKNHGKVALFEGGDLADWEQPRFVTVGDWQVSAGVFSADGPDPASVLLADRLPPLKGRVCDLGAGWGYLSARVLANEHLREVHLVEAEHQALEAAKLNVTDARAKFIWGDARSHRDEGYDHVISNPPFHIGRTADPSLGQAFIASAAGLLKRSGTFWMVANRHLPYEAALEQHFARFEEIGGDNRFKLVKAYKPK
ncbi:class I SAM-dependent methyltransferase [Alphaproteobacteria bacterium KMM 3653]|uniref:Class I SAM-dependent methyltransferase n=1 Tax=Harenicola maris TaxID=2841044 RepID=A0AAP2G4W0_9RHOB|nr:class I SAM-dependent methyltransferase [Harenicola maris]